MDSESMKKNFVGAALAFGVALSSFTGTAEAVTVTTGDTLRIDFALLAPPYDLGAAADMNFFYENLDFSTENATTSLFSGGELIFSTGSLANFTGLFPPLPIYVLLSDIVGDYEVTSAVFTQLNYRVEGTFTLNPVPIPAALPLLAGGIAGLGCIARRRRKKAAVTA